MKQKIDMRLDMHDDKCRSKALTIVAKIKGVESIKIEGKEKDKLVVIGDGVDPVKVATSLRKIGKAEILSVKEVKKVDDEEKKKIFENILASQYCYDYPPVTPYRFPVTPYRVIEDRSDNCSIL